jgi:hypothetical protein
VVAGVTAVLEGPDLNDVADRIEAEWHANPVRQLPRKDPETQRMLNLLELIALLQENGIAADERDEWETLGGE